MKKPNPQSHDQRSGIRRWLFLVFIPAIIAALCLLLAPEPQEEQSPPDSAPASQLATHDAPAKRSLPFGPPTAGELEALGKSAVMFQTPAGQPDPAALPERAIIASNWKTDSDPAISGFAQWTEEFLNADTQTQAAMEREGIAAADARLAALEKQIESDPRRALSNALPQEVRDQLPESIQSRLETRVDGIGEMGRVCEIAKEGNPLIPEYDYAVVDGTRYDAYRYGTGAITRFVDDASIHGIVVNGKLAVLNSPFRTLEPAESPSGKTIDLDQSTFARKGGQQSGTVRALFGDSTAVTTSDVASLEAAETELVMAQARREETAGWQDDPTAQFFSGDSHNVGHAGKIGRTAYTHTTGQKTVLVVRVQIAGYPQMTGSLLDDNFMVARGQDFNTRMLLDSYNKTSLSFTVTPIIHLSSMPSDWYATALAQAQQLYGYNPGSYNARVAIRNDPGWGAAGVHWGNGEMILNNNFDAGVFMHEFGHYLSLPHASRWVSQDGNPMSPNRTVDGYGDGNCWMGAHFSAHPTRTYSPTFTSSMGWFPDSTVQTITRNGTYTVYQYDGAINLNDGRVRALKLARDDEWNYWLSILGNNVENPNMTAYTNGVAIRTEEGYWNHGSWIVDVNTPNGNGDDAPLANGQTWYDSGADITFKVTEVGGTNPNRYAKVQVTFGPSYTGNHRQLVNGGVYRFASFQNTGLSITAPSSTGNQLPLVMSASSDTNALQKWVAWRNSNDGTYSFNRYGTDKWLEVVGNSYANHADIVQGTQNSTDAQRFYVRVTPTGQIWLGHKSPTGHLHSPAGLDMDGGTSDLHQWSANAGAPQQQWNAELLGIVPNQNYRLVTQLGQGQAMDLDGSNPNNGAKVQLWSWNAGSQQTWQMTAATNGNLIFRSMLYPSITRVLDVDTASKKAQGWNYQNGNNQRWVLSRISGNWVRLIPEYDNTLSLQATGTANGTQLTVGTNTGTPGQVWRFADPN